MLPYHPVLGTIVICDFHGFIKPEMVKRRPAVIVSPKSRRTHLCTVIPLSNTEPDPVMTYHCKIELDEPLPPPYNSPYHWLKGDMLYTVSLKRLSLPFTHKEDTGKRIYVIKKLKEADIKRVRTCLLNGIALFHLTEHL